MEVELQDGMSELREVGAELETKYMEKIKVPRAEDEKRWRDLGERRGFGGEEVGEGFKMIEKGKRWRVASFFFIYKYISQSLK